MLDNLTFGNNIYSKNSNNDSSEGLGFCTKYAFSKDMKKYYDMSIEDVIKEIDIYGLLIFLLDDGWYSNHSNVGNLLISSGNLTLSQLKLIQNKFSEYNIETKLIGSRNDISIDSSCNFILLSYLINLFDGLLNIDVIQKKFGKIIKNLNNVCYKCVG